MPLTPSQKSAAFRQRRKEKLERYEAALKEIERDMNYDGRDAHRFWLIADKALNAEA